MAVWTLPKRPGMFLLGWLAFLGSVYILTGTAAADSAQSAKWPENTGEVVYQSGKLFVDASQAAQGYFFAGVPEGCKHRLKLRVTWQGQTLTYDLNQEGNLEVFPLQMGSGEYEVTLYENIAGKKYSQEGLVNISAALSREDIAYLYPNQYVNYHQASAIVAAADEICAGLEGKAAYEAIQNFMQSGFVYDFVRAVTVSPGSLPDIETCMASRMGICQDLSATMVGMLRTQGIPSKLVIGYADENYHAWISATVEGEEIFFDPTAALNAIATPKEYAVERYY